MLSSNGKFLKRQHKNKNPPAHTQNAHDQHHTESQRTFVIVLQHSESSSSRSGISSSTLYNIVECSFRSFSYVQVERYRKTYVAEYRILSKIHLRIAGT